MFTIEELVADISEMVSRVFDWLSIDGSFRLSNLVHKDYVTLKKFY